MKHRIRSFPAACAAAAMILAGSASARAQITVAEGYTPPDDTPAVNVGGTIFANYTYQLEPTVTNSQGDRVHPSSFDVTRAYDEATQYKDPRIWTAQRDKEMWLALEG